ncbi:hypothetical protein [Fluviicola sp.]|uniref:hypothetical protein n=1 Tax=Fluviicola sp. TaxID=1917219 RepID=UPI0031DE037E
MKKHIYSLKGLAIAALTLISLSACKKDEITTKATSHSGSQTATMPNYKFSAVAEIPGEKAENGFLSVKVSSDDEAYLKKYVAKLEQTKIVMTEVSSTEQDEKDVKPLLEEESTSSVTLDFNWDHFSFDREKGKMYQVQIASADQSKSLVYYTAYSNVSGFTSSWGYAAVNVYSTYRYWEAAEFRYYNSNNCKWYFNNTQSYFYNQIMSYQDNLELRIFQNASNNTTPTYTGFQYFTINGIVSYYRPRTNYVSPEMPAGYIDVTAVTAAFGISNYDSSSTPANLTLYIAG